MKYYLSDADGNVLATNALGRVRSMARLASADDPTECYMIWIDANDTLLEVWWLGSCIGHAGDPSMVKGTIH